MDLLLSLFCNCRFGGFCRHHLCEPGRGHWEAAGAAGAFSLVGPAGLFCARNLGTAAMGAYALINKSAPMMEAFLVFRIVVDLLDGLHAVTGGIRPSSLSGFQRRRLKFSC